MIAETKPAIRPGVYDDMPRAVYESLVDEHGNRLVNHSLLKHFAKPPAKAKHEMDFPPEPTEALTTGDCGHAAILEPRRFAAEFVRGLTVDRRTAAGKQAWADFQDASHGKTIVPADDYDACEAMRDTIWAGVLCPEAKAILSSPGRVERSFVWCDEATGLLCKGRCDWMCRWSQWTVIVDLKTSRSAAQDDFSRDIAKYHYASQAAFYLDGLASLASMQRRWFWLVIEKTPPYLPALYEPEDRLLAQGRANYREWMTTYKQCRDTDCWPGYPNGIMPIDVPRWAQTGDE